RGRHAAPIAAHLLLDLPHIVPRLPLRLLRFLPRLHSRQLLLHLRVLLRRRLRRRRARRAACPGMLRRLVRASRQLLARTSRRRGPPRLATFTAAPPAAGARTVRPVVPRRATGPARFSGAAPWGVGPRHDVLGERLHCPRDETVEDRPFKPDPAFAHHRRVTH